MKTIEQIKEMLKKYKAELKEKYAVKEIGIFGSYVKEEYTEESDLNITKFEN
jgi:predicted nucleotidyltransferase